MAINPETQYPGKIAPSTPEYPYGAARNVTVPGDGTGTPWEAALVNDLFGFQQAALSEGGEVPTGTPENATASQYLNALKTIMRGICSGAFNNVADMIAGTRPDGSTAVFKLGALLTTGATSWRVVAGSSPRGVSIPGGFKAIPLNGLWGSDFGMIGDYVDDPVSGTDNTAAFQAAYDVALDIVNNSVIAATNEPGFKVSPRVTIKLYPGSYYLPGTVLADDTTGYPNIGFSGGEDGAAIVGGGANTGFNFDGGAYQCNFEGILFTKFGTAIRYDTSNRNEAMLNMRKCQSFDNDIFIDTVSYATSRSTMVTLKEMHCGETRVFVNGFTDHMTISDSWLYKKRQTDEAMLILSGDGVVDLLDNFYIPHPVVGPDADSARFIDVICDPANGTEADRTIKTVKVRGGRQTLEGASGFIHFFDLNPGKPNGESNRISSITVEDMPLIGLAGQPVIKYRQGYPGSVSFRNVKTLYSGPLVGLDPANTLPPVPSSLETANGTRTDHTIMVDEATRATQGFSLNLMIDPALAPFYYDSTTQTSKFNRSIRRNIDYRLPAEDASAGAGAKHVKVTLPVLFDKTRASNTANRDILSFIVVTVSDARGVDNSNPTYSATAATLVSVVGGNASSVTGRRIIATPLQDAQGGIGYALSAAPTSIHWGTGDTGSATINQAALDGTEDDITIVWNSASTPSNSWAYVLPLAGLRENYWAEYRQNGAW